MVQATKATSTTRRRFLAAAPAALAIGATSAAAASTGVTPELAKMIEEWKVARAEYLRLVEIDNAAVALHHSTAPEIPERIMAWPSKYADGSERFPKEYDGHLRSYDRPYRPGSGLHRCTLRPSWWRLKVETAPWHQPTHWLYENIGIAEAFEAADAASYAVAGCEVATAKMEAAMEAVDALECSFEDFEAQSFADIAAMASVFEVFSNQHIHDWAFGSLLDNVKRVADRAGV